MSKRKRISEVFDCIPPISSEQTEQRAYVNRSDYRETLSEEIYKHHVLIVSGYSGVGKTTLINLATAISELKRLNAPFRSPVSVMAGHTSGDSILRGIYDGISEYVPGKNPGVYSPTNVAKAVHTGQLLLIIDGINCLYGDPASKDLFNLCKVWTELPKGTSVQSKIVLVASGLSGRVSQWLKEAAPPGQRLARDQVSIPGWSPTDLKGIVDAGSRLLGLQFEASVQQWMTRVSCGLPVTMTLLAACTAHRANGDRDEINPSRPITVMLNDLHGVFGEGEKFRNALIHDEKIESLSVSALLALYLLGIHEGRMEENEVYRNLQLHKFPKDDVARELEGLISVERKNESIFWNIMELSYGTFAFLRLYHLWKQMTASDAKEIGAALNALNDATIPDPDEAQKSKGGFRSMDRE
jgi:energy-coupling factor transporter ATP-binding protein EcfA2